MNTLNKDNIFNFFLEMQCCLADKGLEIARKLSVDNLCYEDRVNFILSHIFKKLIRIYNEGDLPTSLTTLLHTTDEYHFRFDDIYIDDELVWSGTVEFDGTRDMVLEEISNKINTNENYNSNITIGSYILLMIQSLNPLDSQTSKTITLGSFYIDGSLNPFSTSIAYGLSFPKYDCLDEQTMCNMINFLKSYCSSNNNCNCK